MKNFRLFIIVMAITFSFSCMAQSNSRISASDKIRNAQLISDSSNDLAVVSYHVEERINMSFGGTVTTYDVPSLNMINNNNLGPNNVRIVTPKYAKSKAVATVAGSMSKAEPKPLADNAALVEEPKVIEVISPIAEKPAKLETVAFEEKNVVITDINKDYITVDIISMDERVLDGGGEKTVEMLKLVANARFFKDEFVKAAKWYSQLFDLTTDLDAIYYFRYAKSLKAIGQNGKSKDMMAIYESKKNN